MRYPASILARGVALAVSLLAAGSAWAEQHVVLYSANDDTVNKLVADGFAKATGIKVDVVSTGSGVLVRRITSEAANPQGDVIWGVSATILRLASPYLQPYPAKDREAVPAQFRDPKDLWLGTNIQVVVIMRRGQPGQGVAVEAAQLGGQEGGPCRSRGGSREQVGQVDAAPDDRDPRRGPLEARDQGGLPARAGDRGEDGDAHEPDDPAGAAPAGTCAT